MCNTNSSFQKQDKEQNMNRRRLESDKGTIEWEGNDINKTHSWPKQPYVIFCLITVSL